MDPSFSTKVKVGITSFTALMILVVGVLWIKDYNPAASKKRFVVLFEDGKGIASGDPVNMAGIKIGEISGVNLTDENMAALEVYITKDVFLTADSDFTIMDIGLMGDKALVIVPGESAEPLDVAVVYHGNASMSMNDLMDEAGKIMDNMVVLSDRLNDNLDFKELAATFTATFTRMDSVMTIYGEVASENRGSLNRSVKNMEEASGNFKQFMIDNDDRFVKLIESFQRTTDRMESALAAMESFSAVADTMSLYMKTGEGTFAKLIRKDDLYEELRSTNAAIDSFITDFRNNPDRYTRKMKFNVDLF